MSPGVDNLFSRQATAGKIVAYYRKLLADSSTSPMMIEIAKRNLAQLEGGTYTIDWDRIARLYARQHKQVPRPALSEVMDKPDAIQETLLPQAQQTKEQSKQDIFDGFADAAEEHRKKREEKEKHNQAMNEAEDDGIPF